MRYASRAPHDMSLDDLLLVYILYLFNWHVNRLFLVVFNSQFLSLKTISRCSCIRASICGWYSKQFQLIEQDSHPHALQTKEGREENQMFLRVLLDFALNDFFLTYQILITGLVLEQDLRSRDGILVRLSSFSQNPEGRPALS